VSAVPAHATARPYDPADPRRWIALVVLLLAAAMDLIDTTVVTIALPTIGDDLGASAAALEWTIAGYALAFGLGQITGGRLGDTFGRRRVFLIGLVGFTAASALCGIAPSVEALVAMRVVQGMFAALMIPQVVAIIAASFPAGDRARAYGMFGAVAGIATVLGPLLSGFVLELDLLSWRPIFLINVPIGLALIVATSAFVRESRAERPPRPDFAGAVLLTVALVLLLLPLVEGQQLGWPAWTLVSMAAVVPAIGLFVIHQHRRERSGASPLVPPALFRRRAFSGGLLATFALFSVPPALLFVTTVTLRSLGFSALDAALSFVPLSLASAPAAIISTALAPRFGRRLMLAGALVIALGIAVLQVAVELSGAALTGWALLPGMAVTGIGLGLVAPTLIDAVQAGVEPADAGAASGVRSTASQLGGAGGVALIGVVFYGTLTSDRAGDFPQALSNGLWFALAVALLSAAAILLLPKDAESPEAVSSEPAPGDPCRSSRLRPAAAEGS
jgi:EmrB/QacA subfamily drug resistance transporter